MSLNFYLEAEHKYDTNMIKKRHKVDRCLARYSPRAITTNQLTNRALNEPEGSAFAQKCILKFSFLSWNKLDSPQKIFRVRVMGRFLVVGIFFEK